MTGKKSCGKQTDVNVMRDWAGGCITDVNGGEEARVLFFRFRVLRRLTLNNACVPLGPNHLPSCYVDRSDKRLKDDNEPAYFSLISLPGFDRQT